MPRFRLPSRLISLVNEATGKPSVEVSKRVMEACELIITEIGAELHDDLIQKLSVLRLHMDKLERSSYDPRETQETMIKMQADFEAIVESVRRISHLYHPVYSEGDSFNKRVEMLCQNLETHGTMRVQPVFNGEPRRLDSTTESYLLRMIQEMVHNAIRHASAWHIWVTLNWEEDHLRVRVADDGSGFTASAAFVDRLRKKYNTLRMRAESINAKMKYEQGDTGLIVTVSIDYASQKPVPESES